MNFTIISTIKGGKFKLFWNYFLYKYSSWKQLKDSGIWWTREPIARPQVLLKESQEESWIVSGRQLPWQRHWIALVAAFGCAICVTSTLYENSVINICTGFLEFLLFSFILVIVLISDYEQIAANIGIRGWWFTNIYYILHVTGTAIFSLCTLKIALVWGTYDKTWYEYARQFVSNSRNINMWKGKEAFCLVFFILTALSAGITK